MPDLSAYTQTSVLAAEGMAASLGIALVCGLLLSWLYRRTYRGPSYSIAFDRSLVTLTMITAIVIMVIGNNLARAFGLVGAMSIIRFRTAVKDAQDLVFIFFSLAVGLASGVGLYSLALGGTVLVGLVIFVMARTNYGALHERELVVQLAFMSSGGRQPADVYSPVMERYCRDFRLLGARGANGGALDLTFYVHLLRPGSAPELTGALQALPQVASVNVFFDEEAE